MSNIINFLNAGGAGHIELNEMRKTRKMITERWEKLGFTEGLEGSMKDNIATIFENTAKVLIKEATTSNGSNGSFETVVFPIVRRVFSKLLANEIVSVQALNLPIGKLFYFLPTTSQRNWNSEGTEGRHSSLIGAKLDNRNTPHTGETPTTIDQYFVPGASSFTPSQSFKKTLYDLFYDDFLYDNSKGTVHIKTISSGLTAVKLNPSQSGSEWISGTSEDFNSEVGIRYVRVELKGFNSYMAGKLIGPDGNEMDTEEFIASLKVVVNEGKSIKTYDGSNNLFVAGETVPFRIVAQKYGKGLIDYNPITGADGKLYIELDFSKPATGGTAWMGALATGATGAIFTGTTTDSLGDNFLITWAQYDTLELDDEMGEVSFELKSVTVDVQERKLRAVWSPELAQDVMAFQNIDAEAELASLLAEQIAAEIDREILRDIRRGAPWVLNWNYNGWRMISPTSTVYTQKEWNQTLVTEINKIDAQVHKATLRGGINFAVVSSEFSAVLNDLNYYNVSDASAESDQYNLGMEKVGSLQGRFTVYRDPYSPFNSIVLGHSGKDLLDTGYIYAPYTPIQLTDKLTTFTNFANVKGIMTRYAKKMVNNRYYGQILGHGLQTWDIKDLR